MLKVLLTVSAIFLFSGCEWCIKRVEVPYEVKIPVKCIVPKPKKESCSLVGLNDVEVIVKLTECIFSYQDAAKVCQ